MQKSKELDIAIKAAKKAGAILKKHFETEIFHEMKDDKSIITATDKESEEIIKKIILGAFPEHSILGEETGHTKNRDTHTWHIDPIDGTRNFARSIPFFAVSIALEYNGEILVGVVYNPTSESLFYAEAGKGAYLNDNPIHVSKHDEKKCIVTISSGRDKTALKLRRSLLHDLPEKVVSSVRDFGCTALDLAYVARGGTEADIKIGLKTYDLCAGVLLVKEAGGKITTLEGKDWELSDGGDFIASNGVFHEALVEEVKSQKEKLGIN
jgi:myo-inositol-1(or 4)-monophosphatase